MPKLILSTGNIMGAGLSVVRRFTTQKSNAEFTSSLRSHFKQAKQAASQKSESTASPGSVNGTTTSQAVPYTSWTSEEGYTIFVPALSASPVGLVEARSQYEITVKLFFLANEPASCRCTQTRHAVDLVLKELRVPSLDLLIVSFPGIAFNAEDEDGTESSDLEKHRHEEELGTDAHAEDLDTLLTTWNCLEQLHDEGVIGKLGVAEFGTERLSKFLSKARVRPSVDQINVRDCCVVPKPLILYAKQEQVELLTHNDCTNILPRGTTRELLGSSGKGAGVLADQESSEGLKGDVEPQWVIKYTAVVKDRGVIENKGYFAEADLRQI